MRFNFIFSVANLSIYYTEVQNYKKMSLIAMKKLFLIVAIQCLDVFKIILYNYISYNQNWFDKLSIYTFFQHYFWICLTLTCYKPLVPFTLLDYSHSFSVEPRAFCLT